MSEQHAVDHGAHHDHADVDRHVRVYVLVFVALLVLTVVTVAISYLDLPTGPAVALALFVALVKGSLVACFFMHLISEKKLILWVLALTVFMFLGVLLGPWITDLDQVKLFGT
ncbi:MAG TPA: cytochrome C oxidase subunit IV family protein [Thermoanaerobaculia bacterium]|nr:cytochrome C oxidase subunit IV family protein [Thermoanaerobaculia bacterium]